MSSLQTNQIAFVISLVRKSAGIDDPQFIGRLIERVDWFMRVEPDIEKLQEAIDRIVSDWNYRNSPL